MATIPTIPVPRQFSIRMPRPLWIGVATVALVAAAIGAHAGLLIYNHHRQDEAIREVGILHGELTWRTRGPAWLHSLVGEPTMDALDEVEGVTFPTEIAIF